MTFQGTKESTAKGYLIFYSVRWKSSSIIKQMTEVAINSFSVMTIMSLQVAFLLKKRGVKGAEMEICWDVMRIFHCTQFIWNFDIELLGISEILEACYEFLVCTYTFKNSRCILKILGAFGKFSRHFTVDYISEVSKDIINFRRISKILSVFSKLLVHFKNSWWIWKVNAYLAFSSISE